MSDDFLDVPRTNIEVRSLASRLRTYFGIADAEHVDVLDCAARGTIWTVKGERPMRLEIVSDDTLKDDEGLTSYDGRSILVQLPRRVRHKAFMGDGHARNTIAHELAHAVMHFEKLARGAVMARRRNGNMTAKWIPAFRSAEHHARVFAPAFLINEQLARSIASVDEISVRFGISRQSADIYFEQLQAEKPTEASTARVARMADEVRAASVTPTTNNSPAFMSDCCSVCGRQTVFPIGHKFMCQTCDTIYDRFQDGDQAQ